MKKPGLLIGGGLCLLAAGCAPSFEQDKVYFSALGAAPGGMLGQKDTRAANAALKAIRKASGKYNDKDQVLLGMDLGMAYHAADHYRDSERIFRKTDRLIGMLFTKSVTDTALSYQLNDYSLPYRGLPYERVMVNLLNSLNYASRGDFSGALVESRKIRQKLIEYNRVYPMTGAPPGKYARYEGTARNFLSRHHISYNPGQLNHYTDDAFARYLSGVFEEAEVVTGAGNYQSAYLSFKRAERTYEKYRLLYGTPVPSFLGPALLRTSEAAGRTNEFRKWRKAYPDVSYVSASGYEKMGHIVFVGLNGKIFHLTQKKFSFPFPLAGTMAMISFAVPEPAGGGTEVSGHQIEVRNPDGSPVLLASSELGDDLMAIGATNFKDHLSRITLREAIRAILKTVEQIVAQRVAYREGGILAQLGTMLGGGIFTYASDQADVRSWRLLPATIDTRVVDLPPGTYDVAINTIGYSSGASLKERVTVMAGQYLLIRTINVPPSSPR